MKRGTGKTTVTRTTLEVIKPNNKSAAVFRKLLKEESYAHFEARSMVLGEVVSLKTAVARITHGGDTTRQNICSCVHKTTKIRKLSPL